MTRNIAGEAKLKGPHRVTCHTPALRLCSILGIDWPPVHCAAAISSGNRLLLPPRRARQHC